MEESIGNILLIMIVIFLATAWIIKQVIFDGGKHMNNREENLLSITSLCELPNCVRCNSNFETLKKARNDFNKIFGSSSKNVRVLDGLYPGGNENNLGHVFYMKGLSSKEFWDVEDLPHSYQIDVIRLVNGIDDILTDVSKIASFNHNDSKTQWDKFYLVNQGKEIKANTKLCSQTYKILCQCNNILESCLFGYVFFSQLKPGCTIEPHKGPTNCRLRCHIPLQIPDAQASECMIKVGSRTQKWKPDAALIFDDSYEHSVTFKPGNEHAKVSNRTVLIVDFWHPNVELDERICLQRCFSSGINILT